MNQEDNVEHKKEVIIVGCFTFVFSLIWNYLVGKDLNWDSINYHFYAGFSLLSDRLSQDFFAAGEQSYLNPIIYLPFSLMVKYGWHSLLVSSVLASIHSVNFILLYMISGEMVGWKKENRTIRLMAFIVGLLSAVVWMFVGSSFSDLLISVFQIAAIYCLLRSYREGLFGKKSVKYWVIGGFLFGVAAGFKLSGLLFCIVYALISSYIFIVCRKKRSLYLFVLSAFFGVLGFLLSSGYWAGLMWWKFGNPYFPFFNGLFASEYYLLDSFSDNRFGGKTLYDVISLPFKMAFPEGWVYLEKIVPDLRFLIGMVFSIGFIISFFLKRNSYKNKNLINIILVFWVAFFLWAKLSGNGRYVLPLFLVIGPVLTILCYQIFGATLYKVPICIIICLQSIVLYTSADTRFARQNWTEDWYDFVIAKDYIDNKHLILTANAISFSFLTKYIHPESSIINIGGTILVENKVVYDEIERIRLKHEGNAIGMFNCSGEEGAIQSCRNYHEPRFERFGFRFTTEKCQISYSGDESKTIIGCPMVYSVKILEEYKRESVRAFEVFERFEQACGYLFQVHMTPINKVGTSYARYYAGDGVRLILRENDDFELGVPWSLYVTRLGKGEYWLSENDDILKSLCSRMVEEGVFRREGVNY